MCLRTVFENYAFVYSAKDQEMVKLSKKDFDVKRKSTNFASGITLTDDSTITDSLTVEVTHFIALDDG